ncbi:hypothetical protein F5148DRAFT_958266, partial [Russula earlei]
SAFQFSDGDWRCMRDACDILKDSNDIQHYFSSEQLPTLWHALPAIEQLQTAWEAKSQDECFSLYHDMMNIGLTKLQKYYSHFDEKPIYVLALILRPYYKLDYIEMAWGGAMEQAVEWRNGNVDAKNWQLEVCRILEKVV